MSKVEVLIKAPIAQTFAYLADPRNRPEWQSSLKWVEMLDSGEPRTGMRWIDVTSVPGIRPSMEITECAPYRVWSERGTWAGVSADLKLSFTQTLHGTRVVADFEVTGGGIWRFASVFAQTMAPKALAADLARAGALIEAEHK